MSTGVLLMSTVTARMAGRDAWLTIVVAAGAGLLLIPVLTALGRRFPGETVIQYLPRLLGRPLGRLLGLLVLWYFLYLSAILPREFADFIGYSVLPSTPRVVVLTAILTVCAALVRAGCEPLVRTAEVLVPLSVLFNLVLFVLIGKDIEVARILPVLENGPLPLLKASAVPAVWFGQLFAIAFLLPKVNVPRRAARAMVGGVLASAALLTLCEFVVVTLLDRLTPRFIFPVWQVARYVSVAEFLEHLDAAFLIACMEGVLIKVSLIYYAVAVGTAQWLGLRDYRPLVLPIGALLVSLSLASFRDIPHFTSFLATAAPPFFFSYEYLLPVGLLAVAWLRGKGLRQ